MSELTDEHTLLAILHEHGAHIPAVGAANRDSLEKALKIFIMKIYNEGYDQGLDRGWEMCRVSGY